MTDFPKFYFLKDWVWISDSYMNHHASSPLKKKKATLENKVVEQSKHDSKLSYE